MLPIVMVKYLWVKLYGAVCTVITEYSPYGLYSASQKCVIQSYGVKSNFNGALNLKLHLPCY